MRISSIAALAAAVLFSGCDPNLFSKAPGHYEGFIAVHEASRTRQVLVGADITAESKNTLTIAVKPLRPGSHESWTFTVRKNKKTLELAPPGELSAAYALKKRDNGCFDKRLDANRREAELCFDGRELAIEFAATKSGQVINLVVDRYELKNRPTYEVPQAYTVGQLVDRALDHNFDTRVEFEHVVQARYTAMGAWTNLVPHIGVSTIVNAIVGTLTLNAETFLRLVGDLAPFLFPDRWFTAKEASLRSRAEKDALILMKADAANIVEGLSYAVLRDAKVIAIFEDNIRFAMQVREEVRAREMAGVVQSGATDDVSAIVNGLEKGLSLLREAHAEEHSSLAQAAGFFNPKAVAGLAMSRQITVDIAESIDVTTTTEVALQRSYELHQLDYLIQAARWNKLSRQFSWLSPAGDISLSLWPSIRVASSQIRELAIKREKIEALIMQKVSDTVGQLNQAAQASRLAQEGVAIQERRVERYLTNMRLGMGAPMTELLNAVQGRVSGEIDQVNAEHAYYLALAKLDRVLFAGQYARIYENAELRRHSYK